MNDSSRAPAYIHRIATAVPAQSVTRDELLAHLESKMADRAAFRVVARFVRHAEIETRYLAALDFQNPEADSLYPSSAEQPAGPGMTDRTRAFEAASGPLVAKVLSELPPAGIRRTTTLVTCSCTHAGSPGLEQHVYRHSALERTADRWHLGFMGCSAALAALRLVWQRPRGAGDGLIVACELSSLHLQYSSRISQNLANALFADGVAAVHVSPDPSPVRVVACRGVALPAQADQMTWSATDNGFALDLAPELPDTLAAHLPPALSEFLGNYGVTREEITYWAVHPGGPRILDAVRDALALDANDLRFSRTVLRDYGNMSSPTILFVLKELIASRPHGKAVAIAFGPGLTIEMTLLDLGG